MTYGTDFEQFGVRFRIRRPWTNRVLAHDRCVTFRTWRGPTRIYVPLGLWADDRRRAELHRRLDHEEVHRQDFGDRFRLFGFPLAYLLPWIQLKYEVRAYARGNLPHHFDTRWFARFYATEMLRRRWWLRWLYRTEDVAQRMIAEYRKAIEEGVVPQTLRAHIRGTTEAPRLSGPVSSPRRSTSTANPDPVGSVMTKQAVHIDQFVRRYGRDPQATHMRWVAAGKPTEYDTLTAAGFTHIEALDILDRIDKAQKANPPKRKKKHKRRGDRRR